MKFLDQVKIFLSSVTVVAAACRSGAEKYVEFGGPDGGNGGKGADVIFEAVDGAEHAARFSLSSAFQSAARRPTAPGATAPGEDAETLVVKVPVGTQILDDDQETLLFDLDQVGQRIVFLKGGDGGFGNAHYKSATNPRPAPFERQAGKGQERWVWLRLKLIADAGIVGLPNAGKSTFLAACSRRNQKSRTIPSPRSAPTSASCASATAISCSPIFRA